MPLILDPLPPVPAPTPVLDNTTQGYLDLITSEHNQRPRFMATVAALVSPVVAAMNVVRSLPVELDLDIAVGSNLDVVGRWIGRSRFIEVELENVYFSFGIDGLGFGQGTWFGPNDSIDGLSALPDDSYRRLLYFTVARNHWDGTVPQAIEILSVLLEDTGLSLVLQDNGDMSMTLGLIGTATDAVTLALFAQGFLDLKPAGVRLTRVVPGFPGAPLFGFGVENSSIAGFGHGAWATAP